MLPYNHSDVYHFAIAVPVCVVQRDSFYARLMEFVMNSMLLIWEELDARHRVRSSKRFWIPNIDESETAALKELHNRYYGNSKDPYTPKECRTFDNVYARIHPASELEGSCYSANAGMWAGYTTTVLEESLIGSTVVTGFVMGG